METNMQTNEMSNNNEFINSDIKKQSLYQYEISEKYIQNIKLLTPYLLMNQSLPIIMKMYLLTVGDDQFIKKDIEKDIEIMNLKIHNKLLTLERNHAILKLENYMLKDQLKTNL